MGIDLRRIYFPLRSNTGWFRNVNLRSEIENRLKQAIFFYDEVIIEDGTYIGMIWENLSFDTYIPPSLSTDRTISLENDIENIDAGLWIQPQGPGTKPVPLVTGKTIARYKIDYYEIIKQVDLAKHDFVRLVTIPDGGLSSEIKSIITQQTDQDQRFFAELKENTFIKKLIFKNLNRDLIISNAIESAVIIAPAHGGILEAKSAQSLQGLRILPDKESAIVRRLLALKFPDFNKLSIDQVVELRNDRLWQEFRDNIAQISNMITNDPDVLLDIEAFNQAVRDAIDNALFEEIEKREQNGIELAADLILGGFSYVPVIGIAADTISAIRSLAEFQEHQNSWIAFLLRASKKRGGN